MKKASKITSIIAGIFGALTTIAVLLTSIFFVLMVLGGVGLLVSTLVYFLRNDHYLNMGFLAPGIALFTIGNLLLLEVAVISFLTLVATVFVFLGMKRKLGFNIVNIIFAPVSFLAYPLFWPFILIHFIIFGVYSFLIPLLFLTPIGWSGLGFVGLVIWGVLFALASFLAGIFGIIARGKDKRQLKEQGETK